MAESLYSRNAYVLDTSKLEPTSEDIFVDQIKWKQTGAEFCQAQSQLGWLLKLCSVLHLKMSPYQFDLLPSLLPTILYFVCVTFLLSFLHMRSSFFTVSFSEVIFTYFGNFNTNACNISTNLLNILTLIVITLLSNTLFCIV